MAKKIYYGVDGKARKVKKIYYGADGKARKVKKGYIGVGGIARPFWTGGELAYYGNSEDGAIEPLYSAPSYNDLASAAVGDYALFEIYSTIELAGYDKHLTRTIINGINGWVSSATETETHAAFDSGVGFDVFDTNLTVRRVKPSNKQYITRYAATAGKKMIFQGDNSAYSIDEDLVASNMTIINPGYTNKGFTSWGDKAVFAGGIYSGNIVPSDKIYVVDENLTITQVETLGVGRYNISATTVGEYALLAGGLMYTTGQANTYQAMSTVEALTKDMTKIYKGSLSRARCEIGCVTNGEIALLGGGNPGSAFGWLDVVDVYNEEGIRAIGTPLDKPRMSIMAEMVGDFFLLAGGVDRLVYNGYDNYPETTTFVDIYTT